MESVNEETTPRTSTDRLAGSDAVLTTLLRNLPVGVLVENSDREIIAVNSALCEILAVERDPSELVGRDCARAAADLKARFADPAQFVDRIETVLERRESVFGEELVLADGRTLERTYVPYALPDGDANLWLYRDVTDRAERVRMLERRIDRLEEFFAAVSHDLRNPLNVATANVECAAEERESEQLDAAADALDRMSLLIEDLLVLARADEAIGDREPVAVDELAWECWSHVETSAATLAVDADRTVRADRSRLAQVFENLFRNAVEHGGCDVTVTVGTVPNGFYVEDDGRGIPADERDRLFDGTASAGGDGAGLGVRIVETIVDAHGWKIAPAESHAGGARFEITDVRFLD